ncbi:VanZ family protein [Amycolatopsis rhabdoformis]|uniref:VanZ family protein n=1 Tax=Amycolatopsis rhabdoformis TaxID=1448059 RepID=A0ABZ1HX11_9PSEU|nr:VanZ family protein [Amycolatopsis rhabdoformis]WSE26495.1 VanZ family protein [Amycolatopsis rhabdoformis]
MTEWSGPTLLALFGGFGLAFLLVVPYAVMSYRRRGEFGPGRAIAALGFLVYCCALITYTLLPTPEIDAAYCATHESLRHPVVNPLQFLSDMKQFHTGLLGNPALRQVLFNVALFVPWGVFLRRLYLKGPAFAIASGFLVSLLIETTQLTGVWFLVDCPYRLFDTGDLLSNTIGAAVGALVAPVFGRPHERLDAKAPRPVRSGRRLFGMLLDLIAVTLLGVALNVAVVAVQLLLDPHKGVGNPVLSAVLGEWVPALVLLLVVPLVGNGATPGQRAVLLTMVTKDDEKPSPSQMVVRFVFGSGGYFVAVGITTALAQPSTFTGLWILLSGLLAIFTRGHRGLSGLVSGLRVADARRARTTDQSGTTQIDVGSR